MLVRELRATLSDCESILDVGCGTGSPLRFVSGPRLVGFDGYAPAIEEARKLQTHDDYVQGDVRKLGEIMAGQQFDACVALDVIEHLSKEDGWKMIEDMSRLARKRIIIFTPNGYIPQQSHDGDLQEHLSGWEAAEMRGGGFEVLGMYGPQAWRGEYHMVNRRPKSLWVLLSMFAHYSRTRRQPEKSAAIFCVKKTQR